MYVYGRSMMLVTLVTGYWIVSSFVEQYVSPVYSYQFLSIVHVSLFIFKSYDVASVYYSITILFYEL